MTKNNEKIPDPKRLEKEIGDFLAKKFGDNVKLVSPMLTPQTLASETDEAPAKSKHILQFDLKPEELIAYLDQYIVKQDHAKAILATKICTHFNRITPDQSRADRLNGMVGSIKNNVLMIGPTGVGKTYMIKLIARKIGVPFVKGDATKFSETGYVGGDVEDLVRDLVREADGDIKLAQCGIIYIDEIDKIASARNLIGADVSRTGVQRALLKPMEETEVDLKVPHDPISMIQEIEQYRKTGKREKNTVNTKNILFIMSGAFAELDPIIRKRISDQGIGFSANIGNDQQQSDTLHHLKSEDLIAFGFESEFVGRLPVRAIFEELTEDDLFHILMNPNNPIIHGKKLDFAAYGIDVKFDKQLLRSVAKNAHNENTGARGLVSAAEKALLPFETKLPSTATKIFPATFDIVEKPDESLKQLAQSPTPPEVNTRFHQLVQQEKDRIRDYIQANHHALSQKHRITLTASRTQLAAEYYSKNIADIGTVLESIKSYYDQTKKIELMFFKDHDINLVLDEDAADHIIATLINSQVDIDTIYQKISGDFELGLKLIKEKTGKNRFFISLQALLEPEDYINNLIKTGLGHQDQLDSEV